MLRSIVELVAFGAFRLWAMALIMAGLALVAAALAVQPMGSDLAWVRVLSGGSLGLAVALVGAGGIAVYVGASDDQMAARSARDPALRRGPASTDG